MKILISQTKEEAGLQAARNGAMMLRQAIAEKGQGTIILATGVSQFAMLAALVREDIKWSNVTAFHLDEYGGISADHPTSFRRYLRERFVECLPQPIGQFHWITAEHNLEKECIRLNELIRNTVIDVAFIGIGENGHLAFNDPPADFATTDPYIVVKLDEACRRQQVGEGWFPTIEDVPLKAISISINQILTARTIICIVSDKRKAVAVFNALEGPITPDVPASILRRHPDCRLFLDAPAASALQ